MKTLSLLIPSQKSRIFRDWINSKSVDPLRDKKLYVIAFEYFLFVRFREVWEQHFQRNK